MNNDNDNGQNGAIVRNEFGADQIQMQHETAATAVAAAEKAAIEARYVLAVRRPRDWDNVLVRLTKECKRPGFADSAIYRKPVGKKKNEQTGQWEQSYIEGLSIRFAEAAIRTVTNFYSSAKTIYDDNDKLITRVTVMDLESNSTIETDVSIAKTVERRELKKGQRALSTRLNSYGDTVFIVPATDDEILNKTNALVSKALRNGVLRLLPGDIQDECENVCRDTQKKRDKADPDAAKRALFDAFSVLGIMPEALKSYLGTTAEVLQPAELAQLRAIYSAIRDGETTWSAVVDGKEGGDEKSGEAKKQVDDLLAKHKAKAAEKAAAKSAPVTPHDQATGEVKPQTEPGKTE